MIPITNTVWWSLGDKGLHIVLPNIYVYLFDSPPAFNFYSLVSWKISPTISENVTYLRKHNSYYFYFYFWVSSGFSFFLENVYRKMNIVSDKIYIQKRNDFPSHFWLASFFHIQSIHLLPFTHPNWVCSVKAEIPFNKMGNFLCCCLKCSPRDIEFTLYGFSAYKPEDEGCVCVSQIQRKKKTRSFSVSISQRHSWVEGTHVQPNCTTQTSLFPLWKDSLAVSHYSLQWRRRGSEWEGGLERVRAIESKGKVPCIRRK